MGLDIRYYEKIKKVGVRTESDDDYEYITIDNPYEFEYQLGSIDKNGLYESAGISKSFRAGSYSGYNQWRNKLAIMAGYPNANAVWEDYDLILNGDGLNYEIRKMKPFYEIIAFSDCEGIIGPESSKKLHQDFIDFDDKAKLVNDLWFYDNYKEWTEAFRVASNGGGVIFN